MQLLFLTELFAGKLLDAFFRMLIHSLWQGLFFTVITGLVMMVTTKSAPLLRYNIMVSLFFGFLIACGFTFVRELTYGVEQVQTLSNINMDINRHGLQYYFRVTIDYSASHAASFVMLWFIAFCFKTVQLVSALFYNKRLQSCRNEPPRPWQHKVAELCKTLRVKQTVLLFESKLIKIPVVAGHLKPVIYIPIGLLASLPPGEVEAVLLHELAHIRRNDYLVNMLQVSAESIFFFNPALLWMSRVLREERENCCDDVAVAHSKNKKQYIQALVSFKEHSLYATSYATAFTARRNQLLKRVSRIVYNRNSPLDRSGKLFFYLSVLCLGLLCVAATGWNTNAIATTKETQKKAGATAWTLVGTPVEEVKKTMFTRVEPVTKNKKVAGRHLKSSGGSAITPHIINVSPNTNINHSASVNQNMVAVHTNKNTNASGNDEWLLMHENQTKEGEPLETNTQQADVYRQQFERERLQAAKDRKQAEADRLQAQKDREQASRDRLQADADRIQAQKDKLQAEKDRQHAQEDRERARTNREHFTAGKV